MKDHDIVVLFYMEENEKKFLSELVIHNPNGEVEKDSSYILTLLDDNLKWLNDCTLHELHLIWEDCKALPREDLKQRVRALINTKQMWMV